MSQQLGNLFQGVFVNGSSNNVIGGSIPALRNLISGNVLDFNGALVYVSGDGVGVSAGASGNRIEGNLIGTAANGITPLGNEGCGIRFAPGAANTTVGGTLPGTANVIAFNGLDAFVNLAGGVSDPGGISDYRNAVLGNSIYSNVGLGIQGDLVNNPVGSGNFPFLGSAMSTNGAITIQGRLNSVSNAAHRIEFFANDAFDPSGFGEGQAFLGSTNVTTDASGYVAFTAVLPVNTTNGQFVTATATDDRNNTSEFSPRLTVGDVLGGVIVVNSADDTDDGIADAAHTTLREAILAADNHPGPDVIHFAIDTGPQTINFFRPPPAFMDPVTMDATTQPGFAGQPLIYLDGQRGLFSGLRLYCPSNTVRGFAINRFTHGIISDGNYSPSVGFNVIEGNYVGTDLSGSGSTGYQSYGILMSGHCVSNRIGGTVSAARNLISGNNSAGIIVASSDGNLIEGNFIGTDLTGTKKLGNGGALDLGGIEVIESNGTIVGGSAPGAGNLVSANFISELMLQDCTGTLVQGNFFGTDLTGTSSLGHGAYGIYIAGAPGQNIVRSNLISSPYFPAILLASSSNFVTGNLIGPDVTGSRSIENQTLGILSGSGRTGNVIGGADADSRNVISGGFDGVELDCCGNFLQGNFIGTAADGVSPLGNRRDGVVVQGSTNLIGGLSPGLANVIAYNGRNGISIAAGIDTGILGNSIFANTNLGIDLGLDGATLNDPGDADVGANNLQNFPVISAVKNTGAGTLISGTLNGPGDTAFHLEFFSDTSCPPSGYGQGRTFLTSITATTDASGNAAFSFNWPVELRDGQVVTATATDPNINTSEFSPCVPVTQDTNSIAVLIGTSGRQVLISWHLSPLGYGLQRTTNLAPPVVWEALSNVVVTNGGLNTIVITNDLSLPEAFFRLRTQ